MNVHVATSLRDALEFKARHPQARPLLGGTDLLAQWRAGVARPDDVLALEPLGELRHLEPDADGITIGAGVTHHVLAHDPRVKERWPALAEAARTVGAPAIQSMGTIGGNLANASPAADLPPVLLVYAARVVVASAERTREVPVGSFFTGYRRVDLAQDELIVAVRIPTPAPGARSTYVKVGTRAAQSIARVALAACLATEAACVIDARFAAASVAPVPVRLGAVEQAVAGQPLNAALAARARRVAAESISPIDDVRGTAAYRRFALGAMVERLLLQLAVTVA